jgi:hypothetical protein
MRYEVQHDTLCQGWVNVWSEESVPLTFADKAEAERELDEFLEDAVEEHRRGHLEEAYRREEFRVVPVGFKDEGIVS